MHDGFKIRTSNLSRIGKMKRERESSPPDARGPKWPRWAQWNPKEGSYSRPDDIPPPWPGMSSSSTGAEQQSKTIWDKEFKEMAQTGNSERGQHIPEQSPIDIEEKSTTSSIEGKEPSMSQTYWDRDGVWEFWGGCW